jgi:hypothetical protein
MTQLLKASTAIPAALLDQYAADGPKGVSLDPADLILPFIKIIQAGTPCADKHRDADYIAGAEPGNFLLGLSEIRDGHRPETSSRNAASSPLSAMAKAIYSRAAARFIRLPAVGKRRSGNTGIRKRARSCRPMPVATG